MLNRRALLLVMMTSLTACADDPAPEVAPLPDEVGGKQVVDRVERLEVGRVHGGYMLTAFAVTQGIGWNRPQLRPRTGMPGADGVFEFEFVVSPPAPVDPAARDAPPPPPPGLTQRLRADTPLPDGLLASARGVRVLGLRGGAEIGFVAAP